MVPPLNPWFKVGTKYIADTHFEAGANLKAATIILDFSSRIKMVKKVMLVLVQASCLSLGEP